MERWRRISLIGILLGNGALLMDDFVISIPHIVMIPALFAALIFIATGFILRKRQQKN